MAKIKTKTIKLSFPHPNPNRVGAVDQLYRVEHLTDSLDYWPGQYLSRKEADTLCAAKSWKVTIVPAPK